MINIVLCDDNTQFLELAKDCIQVECDRISSERMRFKVESAFESGKKVLAYAEKEKIDVLFLDIDMPDMTGFEVAGKICKNYPDTIIIFMSAYDHFVYDSFEFSPFAFMRKKHLAKELPKVLERIVDKISKPLRTIVFNTTEGIKEIYVEDILYIENGQRNYCNIKCINNKTYKYRATLTNVEEKLKGYDFCRIHSGYLVNLEKIERFNGHTDLFVQGEDHSIPISRGKYSELKNRYLEFIRSKRGV